MVRYKYCKDLIKTSSYMNRLILYENVGVFCTKKNIMLVIFVLKTLNILIFIRKEGYRKKREKLHGQDQLIF